MVRQARAAPGRVYHLLNRAVASLLTAAIILGSGWLVSLLRQAGVGEVFRWGAVILCGFYVVGLVALIWAPETKGRPLPED